MEQSEDFWAPRACFLPPIPELSLAADLLHEAADAVLADDLDGARERLRDANIPVVHAFAAKVMGSWDDLIHRRRKVERPTEVTKAQARRPSPGVEAAVFVRDGCRCRYCGVRVVLPGRAPSTSFVANARARMQAGFPEPYAKYAQTAFANLQKEGPVTHASDVAEAVWRAATDPSCPMRLAAGADATALMPF